MKKYSELRGSELRGSEARGVARTFYIFERLDATNIAKKMRVTKASVLRWKREAAQTGDDWDKARMAVIVKGEAQVIHLNQALESFIAIHQKVLKELQIDTRLKSEDKAKLLSRMAESFVRIMNAASRANPSLSHLGIANDVIKRLGDFVTKKYPEHAAVFVEVLEPFAGELTKAYT